MPDEKLQHDDDPPDHVIRPSGIPSGEAIGAAKIVGGTGELAQSPLEVTGESKFSNLEGSGGLSIGGSATVSSTGSAEGSSSAVGEGLSSTAASIDMQVTAEPLPERGPSAPPGAATGAASAGGDPATIGLFAVAGNATASFSATVTPPSPERQALMGRISESQPEPLISVFFDDSGFTAEDIELFLTYVSEVYRELGGTGLKVVGGMTLLPEVAEVAR